MQFASGLRSQHNRLGDRIAHVVGGDVERSVISVRKSDRVGSNRDVDNCGQMHG